MLVTRLFTCLATASILAGCAVGRSVVDVNTPQAANPARGKTVRIESVVDTRTFEENPSQADVPSLDPSADNNSTTKARAIGRKRGGFGKAFGDVVLPEGKTVSGLVEDAVSTAFQESGYRKGDLGYDTAAPVKAQVKEFWSWFAPGFSTVSTNHKAHVDISGGPLTAPAAVKTSVSSSHVVVTESSWREIVEKGLGAIKDQTKALLIR
jgi:hypothetical protein